MPKRISNVMIRLTMEERAMLDREAEADRRQPGVFARMVLLDWLEARKPPEDARDAA
jgi:hypothetical protein